MPASAETVSLCLTGLLLAGKKGLHGPVPRLGDRRAKCGRSARTIFAIFHGTALPWLYVPRKRILGKMPKRSGKRRRVVMVRRVKLWEATRDFDREFWRRMGVSAMMEAAWEMVRDAHSWF